MKKRFMEYDIELFNQIIDAKDFPNIIGTSNNKLECLWCRNFREVVKVNTSIIIKGLPANTISGNNYLTNVEFEISPKQAEEIIKELQGVLKRRKKNQKQGEKK